MPAFAAIRRMEIALQPRVFMGEEFWWRSVSAITPEQ